MLPSSVDFSDTKKAYSNECNFILLCNFLFAIETLLASLQPIQKVYYKTIY